MLFFLRPKKKKTLINPKLNDHHPIIWVNSTHKDPPTQDFRRITLPTEEFWEWPNSSLHREKCFKSQGFRFKTRDGQTGVLNSRGATLFVIRIQPFSAVLRLSFVLFFSYLTSCVKTLGSLPVEHWSCWALKCHSFCGWTRTINLQLQELQVSTLTPWAICWLLKCIHWNTFILCFWATELQNRYFSIVRLDPPTLRFRVSCVGNWAICLLLVYISPGKHI